MKNNFTKILYIFIIISLLLGLSAFILQFTSKCSNFQKNQNKNQNDPKTFFKNSFGFLVEILKNREWWVCEGTLIGALRFGSNFGKLDSYPEMAVDTDIDIMVRVKNQEDFIKLKNHINKMLKEKGWGSYTAKLNGDYSVEKIVCNPGKTVRMCGYDIHFDIHPYIVDEQDNTVYMDIKSKNENSNSLYPFQKWNGSVKYKGFLVNENGKFLKGKMDNFDINIPYKYMEILSKWNNSEYKPEGLPYPTSNPCVLKNNKWKTHIEKNGIDEDGYKGSYDLTIKDKEILKQYRQNLKNNGYASF
jgi:hypothetical protein